MKSGSGTSYTRNGLGGFGLLILFIITALAAIPAHAVCSSPSGTAGDMMYNASENVMQYCDNTNWIAMGTAGTSWNALSQMPATPFAYWSFDEGSGSTANDSIGANHGTLNGMESGDWVNGISGGALQFDGTSAEYVLMPQDELDFTGDLTYAAWVRPSGAAVNQGPYSWAEDFWGGQYGVSIGTGANEWRCFGSSPLDFTNVILNDGVNDKWWHIACVIDDDTDTLSMYINGELVDTTNIGELSYPTAPYVPRAFRIGYNFPGIVDEMVIYDRELNAAEVAQLMLAGGGDSSDLNTGLVGHWKLDETSGSSIADSTGNGNTGTWSDSADNNVTGETAAGQIGTALGFDGSNDYISVGDSASLDITSGFSITGWVFLNASTMGYVLEKATSGNLANYFFAYDPAGTEDTCGFRDSGGTWHVLTSDVFSGAPLTGTWYHLACTYDLQVIRLYVNGVQVDSTAATATPFANNGPLWIGRSNWNNNYSVNGRLDDVRLYSRALGAEEIVALANGASGCVGPAGGAGDLIYNFVTNQMQYCNGSNWVAMGPPPGSGGGPSGDYISGLIGHWPLDETSGTTANDIIGVSNGTMQGSMDAAADTVPGKVGTALDFDGTNDRINFGSDSSIDNIGAMSIAFWMNMDISNAYQSIIGKNNTIDSISNGWALIEDWGAGGGLWFRAAFSGGQLHVGTVGNTILDDTWHHVVVTWDGTRFASGVHIYVDGIEAEYDILTNGIGSYVSDASYSLNAGRVSTDAPYFNGYLDDIRLYNRVLSPADVLALYGSTGGVTPDYTSNLIHHWRLDEGTGTTTNDAVGTTNGTLTSSPSWVSGQIGGALEFANATYDYVQITDHADYSFNPATSYTWTAWIRPDSFDEWSTVWTQQVGTTTQAFSIFAHTTTDGNWGPVTAGISAGPDNAGGSSNDLIAHTTNNVLTAGTWAHVAVTYNASVSQANRLRIYVNGVNVTATGDIYSSGTLGSFNPTNIWIGANAAASTEEFHGVIDDVRMYNRALSNLDVAALYTSSLGCSGPAGPAGAMMYNTSGDVMQYCNGAEWIGIGKADIPCTAPVENFTTPGMTTTTVPTGCSTAVFEAWGAGGGGGFSTTTSPGTNNRAGGGGGGSGVQRASNNTVLTAAGGGGGGGNASGSNNSNHRAGGGGGYVISAPTAVVEGETLNVYVGAGGASSCSGQPSGNGGGYNGTNGASGSTPSAVTNPPGMGGGGGNNGNNNGGSSTYGGAGGNAGAGSAGTSTYGGNGGSGAGGGAGGGFGGTVTNGTAGSGANTPGAGASGGGFSAGSGAAGNNCSNVGGNGRARITWSD